MSEVEWNLDDIVTPLLVWYRKSARKLPWRETKNPYAIWISEIMLQQTRVETVIGYYERFLKTLPSVEALAGADEEVLLKLWEGLGYYSRVRNMQVAAKEILNRFEGDFPSSYQELLSLRGIGPYTAGAIASIAFSLPHAAVDGNVLRVMSRLSRDGRDIMLQTTKQDWQHRLAEILPEDSGTFNQALMELGACICVPNGAPRCMQCPLREKCQAYRYRVIAHYPVKSQKKIRKVENINVFFMIKKGEVALRKRPDRGLLSSLWELPNSEGGNDVLEVLQAWGITEAEIIEMKSQKHIFTHIEWRMSPYFIWVKNGENSQFNWVSLEDMRENYALPTAFRKICAEGLKYMEETNEL